MSEYTNHVHIRWNSTDFYLEVRDTNQSSRELELEAFALLLITLSMASQLTQHRKYVSSVPYFLRCRPFRIPPGISMRKTMNGNGISDLTSVFIPFFFDPFSA